MYPERGLDFMSKNPVNFNQVLEQDEIQELIFFSIKVEIFSDLVDQIQKEVWKGKYYKEVHKKLERGESVADYPLEPQSKLLLFKDRMVFSPNQEIQLDILQKCHDSPLAGHPGQGNPQSHQEVFLFGWNESNHQGLCLLMSESLKKQEYSI
ncbi:hypothetical protein O181_011521 [Austropuccinia psidii MF-1]|uniref:Integrase zinc-binding domain-containing protein n=1 Tax=Austropuccinia psidii MF-1 TaxID=1389203 RepID=A0A9Q3GLE6_9BASI|nr:hypothetical protein [Austropuccinia psidii MF-1]